MASSICIKAIASRSIVLMARIVDRAGTPIRRSDVIAIEYSLYESDLCWPEQLTVVGGQRRVPLAIGDVLFDSPQVGRSWNVDDVGYNFRHEIEFGCPPSKAGWRYELAYRLTIKSVRMATVRFKLRCSMFGNPLPNFPRKEEGV